MKEYVKALGEYLSGNPPRLSKCQMEKVLDLLYCCYSQQKGNDTEQIRQSFCRIDKILEKLPLHQQDAVVDVTCDLCINHQREGFRDGIMIGFRLLQELS